MWRNEESHDKPTCADDAEDRPERDATPS